MRKIIAALAVALLVSGCATLSNFVTVGGVYELDAAVGLAASALKGYRDLCKKRQPAVYPRCREIVPKLQDDLRIARGQVKQAVAYVRANPNDTVGLSNLVSQAQASIAQLKSDLRGAQP